MQRQLYEQACRKSKEREDAKAKELERRRQADVQEQMRKKLLEQRNLQFKGHFRFIPAWAGNSC